MIVYKSSINSSSPISEDRELAESAPRAHQIGIRLNKKLSHQNVTFLQELGFKICPRQIQS